MLTLTASVAWPAAAQAQVEELDEGDEVSDAQPAWLKMGPTAESFVRIIQRRKYVLRHELDLMGSGLPIDPMYKGLSATLGYAFHFNHYLAWEVLRGSYLYAYPTLLKKQLRLSQLAQIDPRVDQVLSARDQLAWYVASRLVLKPLYGKQGLLDRGLVHIEVFVAAGPAYAVLDKVFSPSASRRHVWGLDVALGLRLWLGQHVSVRAELGDLVHLAPKLGHALHAGGGLAVSFGGRH